ncbi:unnamed protein product, partial [Didymodactylos carnosus]
MKIYLLHTLCNLFQLQLMTTTQQFTWNNSTYLQKYRTIYPTLIVTTTTTTTAMKLSDTNTKAQQYYNTITSTSPPWGKSLSKIIMYIETSHFLSNFLGCRFVSLNRLECRNYYNFHLTSYSFCENNYFKYVLIDELILHNDYNCFDIQWQCYVEIDHSWTKCLTSLKKLIIKNLSFIILLPKTTSYDEKTPPKLDYLKIENTHGSVTELLNLFYFSNLSSIFIQNLYPRWTGLDLYSMYIKTFHTRNVIPKQFWLNVVDWYPVIYLNVQQKSLIKNWLHAITCLHIELGNCITYQQDMIYLRDIFTSRMEFKQNNNNELFCYMDRGTKRHHWTEIVELKYSCCQPVPYRTANSIVHMTERKEECFYQFLKERYTINSRTDLLDFYDNFKYVESYRIPYLRPRQYISSPLKLHNAYSSVWSKPPNFYNNPLSITQKLDVNKITIEYTWLSTVEAHNDGRFLMADNANHKLFLLDHQGRYRIDLTSLYLNQLKYTSSSSTNQHYSFHQIRIDFDGYIFMIPLLCYEFYIFSPINQLYKILTANTLNMSVLHGDCMAVAHSGLIYVCDNTNRAIRTYTRVGIFQKMFRIDYLPLKLFISNNLLFTYSLEKVASIRLYTVIGTYVQTLYMCAYNLPNDINWFRGKYFLTCGTTMTTSTHSTDDIKTQTQLLTDSNNNMIRNFKNRNEKTYAEELRIAKLIDHNIDDATIKEKISKIQQSIPNSASFDLDTIAYALHASDYNVQSAIEILESGSSELQNSTQKSSETDTVAHDKEQQQAPFSSSNRPSEQQQSLPPQTFTQTISSTPQLNNIRTSRPSSSRVPGRGGPFLDNSRFDGNYSPKPSNNGGSNHNRLRYPNRNALSRNRRGPYYEPRTNDKQQPQQLSENKQSRDNYLQQSPSDTKISEELNENFIRDDDSRTSPTDLTNESLNDEYESTVKSLTFNNSLQTPSSVPISLLTLDVDVKKPDNALPPRSFKNRNALTSHTQAASLLDNSSTCNNKPNEPSKLAVSMHEAVQYSNKPIDVQFGDIHWVNGNADESIPAAIEDSMNCLRISSTDEEHLTTLPVKNDQQTSPHSSSFSSPNTLTMKCNTDLYPEDLSSNFNGTNDKNDNESDILSYPQQELSSPSTNLLTKPVWSNFQQNKSSLSESNLTSNNSVINNSAHLSDHLKQHPEQSSSTSYVQPQSNPSSSQKIPPHTTNSSTTMIQHSTRNGNNQQHQQLYNSNLFQQQQQPHGISLINMQANVPSSGTYTQMTRDMYPVNYQQQPHAWNQQPLHYIKNSQNKNIRQPPVSHHPNMYHPTQAFQTPSPTYQLYPILSYDGALYSPSFDQQNTFFLSSPYHQTAPTPKSPSGNMGKSSTLSATAATFTAPPTILPIYPNSYPYALQTNTTTTDRSYQTDKHDNRNSPNNRNSHYSNPNYQNSNRMNNTDWNRIPSKVRKAIEDCLEKGGENFDLNDIQLDSFVDFWNLFSSHLRRLIQLNLSHNKFKSLPQNIADLSHLQVLNLTNNNLEELPLTISVLSKLRILKLGFNRLSTLPVSLGSCYTLEILDLTGNELNENTIPNSFFKLKIRALYLGDNKFETIPTNIEYLENLQI